MKQPNILFIFPDQWRGDSLSCLGHPIAETPFIDDIARNGVTFTSAYTNVPTCIAARACLMTGQTPASVGRHAYRDRIPWPYKNTFPRLLRDAGYQTMMSGKTHFHPPRVHLGFEQMALYDNQRWSIDFRNDYDEWLAEKTDGLIKDTAQELNSNSFIVQEWKHDENLHCNSWAVTEAIRMLRHRDPTRPFMLQLSFHRPHPPLDPPVEFYRRFENKELPEVKSGDWSEHFAENEWNPIAFSGKAPEYLLDRTRRGYYAQLAHIDYQVGRMIRFLQLNKMLDDTMIIFSSDHGEMLGDHNLFRKAFPFESSAKIPLVIQPPKGREFKRGSRRDQPVLLHDIMPTILDGAGVDIPDTVEGKSLLSLAEDEHARWRDCAAFEHTNTHIGPWQALCDGKEKYVWQTVTGEEYLFDLVNDPDESHNCINDPDKAGRAEYWRGRLAEELVCYEEDGLVKDGKLNPGHEVPAYRDWLLE